MKEITSFRSFSVLFLNIKNIYNLYVTDTIKSPNTDIIRVIYCIIT